MNPGAGRTEAFTRKELVVVLAVTAVLIALLVPSVDRMNQKSDRITCINNMKQIGIAYRIWSNDNGDQFPAAVPQTNGGWRDLLYFSSASTYAWTNFAAMAKELGPSPNVLVCPTDERKPAGSFAALLSNTNISYFVGVDANDTYPQGLLGGDRNLAPGTTPGPDYGFSPADGKGNDVMITGQVCWSLKMHSAGTSDGAGNIMLGDGSAQQVTSGNLRVNWMKAAMEDVKMPGTATNVPGIRLIFP